MSVVFTCTASDFYGTGEGGGIGGEVEVTLVDNEGTEIKLYYKDPKAAPRVGCSYKLLLIEEKTP